MPSQIKAFWEHHREALTTSATILIVSLLSFALGRFSAGAPGGFALPPRSESAVASAAAALAPTNAAFVAKKTGSKYYPISCAAANSIPESERVYFASAPNAEASGYTAAASCAAPRPAGDQ